MKQLSCGPEASHISIIKAGKSRPETDGSKIAPTAASASYNVLILAQSPTAFENLRRELTFRLLCGYFGVHNVSDSDKMDVFSRLESEAS